ncbi:MAG TPA: ATP-dependent DNA helicase [Acidimicrobiia bacterium]|nr:ATP-dependent DNA helicase [Acidimicrobiia bacterium]
MALTTSALMLSDPSRWAEAIADIDGPQLVLAGPGTGKTEFLARRVARLVEAGIPTERVAVLTFSRRAAAELEIRITDKLKRPRSGATATTFHSFAHRIVETGFAAAGQPMPVLMTGPEQVRLVGSLLANERSADWPAAFRPMLATPTLAAEVADFVMRCNERLIDPELLSVLAGDRADWRALPGFLGRYRQSLAAQDRIDYGGLVVEAVEFASARPSPAEQFDYVVVDEYQDTTPAQARLAEVVAGANITVAADPHQSIYAFRGADLANVEDFATRMDAGTGLTPKIIGLVQSLRVPAAILDSARRLVAPNPSGLAAQLAVEPAPHDGQVEAYVFDQRSGEAEWIAAEVERLHIAGSIPLRSMAVVVRSTRHLLPELSRALERRRILHDRADARLIDHPAIRLIHDVVLAATSPPDSPESERAVTRLLLGPLLALPLGRQRELMRLRRRRRLTWPELIRSELADSAPLAALIEDPTWATGPAAVDGFWHLWDSMPHVEKLVGDPSRADYRAAWSTFTRMLERQAERDTTVSLADTLEATVSGDFEATPLLSFSRPDEDRLVVTTLHQAKGLEFEVVFIADAIEGVFPDTRRWRALLQPDLLSGASGAADRVMDRLADERRLAYTASTRARRRVVWTATTAGIDEGERRPSRFLLPAAGVESFEQLGPPPTVDPPGFAPLTLTDAQARLRRSVADPTHGTLPRLASLAVLADDDAPWEARFFPGVPERGSDSGVIGDHIRLSPSQATLYDRCPRLYVLERRLRAVDVQSPYLLFGSIVHTVLEETEKEAMAAGFGHGTMEMARRHLAAAWEEHADFGTPEMDWAWHRRADDLLTRAYANWPGGDDRPIALEIELTAVIGGVEWTGRADRIDATPGGIKIIDYKTSKTPPTLKDAAASLQLGFYALAAARHPALAAAGPVAGAELWYPLADGRKVFPFAMERLDEVEDALASVAAGILAEDWSPRVSAHCERCDFRLVCPAWPDSREAAR